MTTAETAILVTAIVGSAATVSLMIAAWVKINIKLASLEVKILQCEKNDEHIDKTTTLIFNKLDGMTKDLTEIKISLKDKADRE